MHGVRGGMGSGGRGCGGGNGWLGSGMCICIASETY